MLCADRRGRHFPLDVRAVRGTESSGHHAMALAARGNMVSVHCGPPLEAGTGASGWIHCQWH